MAIVTGSTVSHNTYDIPNTVYRKYVTRLYFSPLFYIPLGKFQSWNQPFKRSLKILKQLLRLLPFKRWKGVEQGLLTSMLLMFQVGQVSAVWGAALCVLGCSAASLISTYQMPVASSCHNETCLWTLPNVPWEANLLLAEKYWSRVCVKQANKLQARLFKIQLQHKVVCPRHQRSHLCRQQHVASSEVRPKACRGQWGA